MLPLFKPIFKFYFNIQIEDLTMAMFEDADRFNRGAITYEALKNQLEKHGGLLENLTIRYVHERFSFVLFAF